MGISYVATTILLLLSPSARAFMAFGVQEVTNKFALERQRLSTGSQQGFVALREAPGIEVQKSRDIRTRRDGACRLLSRRSTRNMRNVCRHQKMAPLMALDPDTVYSANEWIAGVAGGSVGVLGTLIQLELKQERLRSRRNCPFCNGSGKLVCATCCGSGTFTNKLAGSETYSTLPCASCSGKRYITCLNCRGDGRAVPRELDRKMTDAVEVDLKLEEIGMGSVGQ